MLRKRDKTFNLFESKRTTNSHLQMQTNYRHQLLHTQTQKNPIHYEYEKCSQFFLQSIFVKQNENYTHGETFLLFFFCLISLRSHLGDFLCCTIHPLESVPSAFLYTFTKYVY